MSKNIPIHPKTSIGHVHLKVSDLERALTFYTEVLGFEITTRMGDSAVFLSAGGYHHHIGLNTWESQGGPAPASNSTGLYHVAILMPDRRELASVINRLIDHDWPIDGMADHGVSEAIYLKDPDGNGLEIYADRPQEKWPIDEKGNVMMYTHPLDLQGLIRKS
jgi:catechol 2,3-dioxygenase